MVKKVAVIGAGSMGTALSILLGSNGHDVRLWTPFEAEAAMISEHREQKDKLPGARVPDNVTVSTNLSACAEGAALVVMVVPAQTVRENARRLRGISFEGPVVCFSKGLEDGTGLRMSQVIEEELPGAVPVAMSGPCHAEELAKGIPSAYVAASRSKSAAELTQDVFMTQGFRVYTNPDIIGVELGGSLKNVIALCAGISDGLGYGDNTKAMLMTRGMTEIARLGTRLGANPHTFSGLTGVGDLIVTCTSMHSRNRRAGILLGQGKTREEAQTEIRMVVEGIATTKAAWELAQKLGVVMPITEQAYQILFEGASARAAVGKLMGRDKKHEMEEIAADNNWM